MNGIKTPLEVKSNGSPTNETVSEFMTTLTEYQSTVDSVKSQVVGVADTLNQIKSSDVLTQQKLARMDTFLDKFEEFSAKATKVDAVAEEIKQLDEKFDRIDRQFAAWPRPRSPSRRKRLPLTPGSVLPTRQSLWVTTRSVMMSVPTSSQ